MTASGASPIIFGRDVREGALACALALERPCSAYASVGPIFAVCTVKTEHPKAPIAGTMRTMTADICPNAAEEGEREREW